MLVDGRNRHIKECRHRLLGTPDTFILICYLYAFLLVVRMKVRNSAVLFRISNFFAIMLKGAYCPTVIVIPNSGLAFMASMSSLTVSLGVVFVARFQPSLFTQTDLPSAHLGKNNDLIANRLILLISCKSVILNHFLIVSFPMVRPSWSNWWLQVNPKNEGLRASFLRSMNL